MRILRCGGVASPHLRRSYDRGIFSFKKTIGDYETQYNYHDEFSPIFKSQYDSFILILKNLNYNSKITNRVENRVETRVVKKADEMLQRYKDIKAIIRYNPRVTKREIEEKLGLSRQKVDRAIAHLQEEGELTREGSDRDGKWILINNSTAVPVTENRDSYKSG